MEKSKMTGNSCDFRSFFNGMCYRSCHFTTFTSLFSVTPKLLSSFFLYIMPSNHIFSCLRNGVKKIFEKRCDVSRRETTGQYEYAIMRLYNKERTEQRYRIVKTLVYIKEEFFKCLTLLNFL